MPRMRDRDSKARKVEPPSQEPEPPVIDRETYLIGGSGAPVPGPVGGQLIGGELSPTEEELEYAETIEALRRKEQERRAP